MKIIAKPGASYSRLGPKYSMVARIIAVFHTPKVRLLLCTVNSLSSSSSAAAAAAAFTENSEVVDVREEIIYTSDLASTYNK